MRINKSVWILVVVFLLGIALVSSADITFLTSYTQDVDSCQSAVYSFSFSSSVDDSVSLSLKEDVEHSFSSNSFVLSAGESSVISLVVSPGCVVGKNDYTLVVKSSSGIFEYPLVVNLRNIYSHSLNNAKYISDSVVYYNDGYQICKDEKARIPIVIENRVDVGNSYNFLLDGADFAELEANSIDLFAKQKGLVDLVLNPKSTGNFRFKVASKSTRGDVIVDTSLDVNVADCYAFNVSVPTLLNGCFGDDLSFYLGIKNLGVSTQNFTIKSSSCLTLPESVFVADGQLKNIPVVLNGDCKDKKVSLEISNLKETKKFILPVSLASQNVCYNANVLTKKVVVGTNPFIEIRNDGTQNLTLDLSLNPNLADLGSKKLILSPGETGKTNLAINTDVFSGIQKVTFNAGLKDRAVFQKTIYFFNGFNFIDYVKYYWYISIVVVLVLVYLFIKLLKRFRKFRRRHVTEFRLETLDGSMEVQVPNSVIKSINLKTKFLLTDVGFDIVSGSDSFSITPVNSEISDFEKIEVVLNVDEKYVADNFVKMPYLEFNGARVDVVKSKGSYRFVVNSFGKFILNYEIDEEKKKIAEEKLKLLQEKTRLAEEKRKSFEEDRLKKEQERVLKEQKKLQKEDSVVESVKVVSSNVGSKYVETLDVNEEITSSFRQSFWFVSLIVILAGLFIVLSYYGFLWYLLGLVVVILLIYLLFRKKADVILDDTEELKVVKSDSNFNGKESPKETSSGVTSSKGFIAKFIDFLTEEETVDDGNVYNQEKKNHNEQLKIIEKEQKRLAKERLQADKEYQKKIEFEEKKLAAERAKLEKDFERKTAEENKRLNLEKQEFEKNMLVKIKDEESKLNIEKERLAKEYETQLGEFNLKKELESKKLQVESETLKALKLNLDSKEKDIIVREKDIDSKLMKLNSDKESVERRLVEISIKEKEIDMQILKLKKDQEEVESKLDEIYEREKELDSKLYNLDIEVKSKYEELSKKEKLIKQQEKLISTSKIEAERKVNQVLDKISKKELEIERLQKGKTGFNFKYVFYIIVGVIVLAGLIYLIVNFFNRPILSVDTSFLVNSLDNAVNNPVIETPKDNGSVLKYLLLVVVLLYVYVAFKRMKSRSVVTKPNVDLDTDVHHPEDEKF